MAINFCSLKRQKPLYRSTSSSFEAPVPRFVDKARLGSNLVLSLRGFKTEIEQKKILLKACSTLKSKLLEEKGILETELAELMEQFNGKKAKINH